MKKIIVFSLCFFLLSSNVFASSLYDEECYSEPYKKVLTKSRSISDTIRTDAEHKWYDKWNKVFAPAKGYFANTYEWFGDCITWWKNVLHKDTDEEVAQYFEDNTTIDSNNNYSFTQEFNNYIVQYSNHFQTEVGTPFIYPCLDVYGKNFKSSGANVNTSLFERIFEKYGDNYIIVLGLQPSAYDSNYYFNLSSTNLLNSIRLYPFSNLPIYNYGGDAAGNTSRYFFGRTPSEMYYYLDENLNLVSYNIQAGNSYSGAMFLLGFYKQNDLTLGIRPPWVNYSFYYQVPICYKENKTIQLYFSNQNIVNGYGGVNVNLDNVYWNNGAPVSRSNELPTVQEINDYRSYVENISGDTVNSNDIYNYITNVYPNGNDYQNEPLVNDKPGGLLTSLGDGLGALGTLIGSIIGSIINALVNILLGILQAFTAIVNVFTSSFPSSFRSFMEVFYGLIPEPIMNGIIALFSLTCIMAVIRIIRK